MNRVTGVIGAALLAVASPVTSALANKADDTVRIAFGVELDNPDVYFSALREAVVFGYNVFDPLVERNPINGEWVGNLAESFKWVDDTTLEFNLRQNVKFHNGEPFDADDVVFTFNHFSDPATGATASFNKMEWIKTAEKIDKYRVRIILKFPFPTALDYIQSSIPIYPSEYYQQAGEQGFSRKPVGTGPYEVVSIDPGRSYTLKANANYHAGGPRQKARIQNVEVRAIPDINTQIAELFSKTADFLWRVPEDQTEKIAEYGGFNVVTSPSVRFGYLTLDAAGRTGAQSPMKDLKVRQAIYHAIDRKAVRDAFFPDSDVINAACSPLQFGCEQAVKTYDYNPEKAKALLTAAGYPDGFSTTFYFSRDEKAIQAIAQMLGDVGIKAELLTMKIAALTERKMRGEVALGFFTHGSASIEDVAASTSKFFDGSAVDYSHNTVLTSLLKAGDTTTDIKARLENYSKALKIIADEVYWVPLWTYTVGYAMSTELEFTPTHDEIVRFYDMDWK